MSNTTRNLLDVPTIELRRMLHETERQYGPDTQAARVLRRVLRYRERLSKEDRHANH